MAFGMPHRFTGEGRANFRWKFAGGGRQVMFEQSFPHGELREYYELRDVRAERLLGTLDPDETPQTPLGTKGTR
jgi:hypothetical protein